MIFATDLPKRQEFDKYAVVITHPTLKITFTGLLEGDSTEWEYATRLNTPNGGWQDALLEKAGPIGNIINNTHQKLTGATIGESILSNTIKRPTSEYSQPNIQVSMTLYKGLQIGSNAPTKSFKGFMSDVEACTLPKTIENTYLRTPQVDIKTYLAEGMAKLVTVGGARTLASRLWKVRIGNIINKQGFWLTDARVSQKHALDKDGQPIIWTASFTLEYFRQLTQEDKLFG